MAKNEVYTEKQLSLLKLWKTNQLKRLNILVGSVRSGKTWISLVLWAFFVATSPKDGKYLMVAKTLTSLKRNCLDLLEMLIGSAYFTFSLSKKEGELFGRKVYLEGVNDARSESKIRGMTLNGAYCDELTLFTEDFFNMLLSRLSCKGAKLIGTTNPDSPTHWLKKNYLDKGDKLDMLKMDFLIDDNTFLDPEYVENLKKEYTGVFYERFILGKWVMAEGLIYPLFAEHADRYFIKRNEIPSLKYIHIGVDFGGNKSQHAFAAEGFDSSLSRVYVLKSACVKATGTSVSDIVTAFLLFAESIEREFGFVDYVYADSAEQAIINEMRGKTKYNIVNSVKNAIIDRIRTTDVLLSTERIKLLEGENDALADGLRNALWKGKSDKDERLDDGTTNIDILDAFEYGFEPFINYLLEG